MFTEEKKKKKTPTYFPRYLKRIFSKISNESAESQQKMDRRKKRTSSEQYSMYIDLMEKDPIFATGKVPRDLDVNYLQKKWKQLSDRLNTCNCGPTLTSDEWRKRLNDWKNTTRCKYRRSLSGEKDIAMTSLELKALALFGKAPHIAVTDSNSIHLKSEKEDADDDMDQQRTSESFQKELQAAVEEAIGGEDEDDGMVEEDHEDIADPLSANVANVGTAGGGGTTTYRTIVVSNNTTFTDEEAEEEDENIEYIPHRRQTIGQTTVTATTANAGVQTTHAPTRTMTKLINGDVPIKRLRSHMHDQIIYEVKKAPITPQQPQRSITIHNTSVAPISINPQYQQQQQQSQQQQPDNHANNSLHIGGTAQDMREIAKQLKRLADAKTEKLKFEVARFKFNNPGFQYDVQLS